MATRSRIAVKGSNGIIKSVYCHYDGYYSYVGSKLLNHHNSQTLAELLVSFGDMSRLSDLSIPTSENHSFDNPENNVSVYYGRDRKDDDVDALEYPTEDEFFKDCKNDDFFGIEYWYYWNGNEWIATESSNIYNDYKQMEWLKLTKELTTEKDVDYSNVL